MYSDGRGSTETTTVPGDTMSCSPPPSGPVLPHGLELDRTTTEFDETTVPPGLLRAHRVAKGVWGNLVVRAGSIDFTFEDDDKAVRSLVAGDSQAIPPQRPHRIVLTGPARFAVEFHRPAAASD